MNCPSDSYPGEPKPGSAERDAGVKISEPIARVPPTRLLVTTPLHLFLFDSQAGRLTELRSGDGEYYGLGWRREAIFVGHSRVNNEDLLTNADLQAADRGDVIGYAGERVLAATPRRLFLAHQIEWSSDRRLSSTPGVSVCRPTPAMAL
jgi:hypothetical protein